MKKITVEKLKQMGNSEGLVLQGCGGDLEEWVNGIHTTLTEKEILLGGATFKDIYTFEHEDITNLLFSFNDMGKDELAVGKLAMWRIQTKPNFGSTWLSDYLVNTIGIEQNEQMEHDHTQTM